MLQNVMGIVGTSQVQNSKKKAMQREAVFGGGSIRGKDTQVKCSYCNGDGVINSQ